MVPFDTRSPFVTSGIRVGTAAVTTRGMKEQEMERIVELIDQVLMNLEDDKTIRGVKEEVNNWMKDYPLYMKG